MADELRTIDDLDVDGRRVLLRADLNVPLRHAHNGTAERVVDDSRIRAALTSIEELSRRGARVVLVSHLGQPHGRDPDLSMRPVADRLAKLTGAPVPLAPGAVGPLVRRLTERVPPGQILMLENVRFEPGETRNDPAFASALAQLADYYIDDAFAIAHHAYASTEGVAHRLPSAAGCLMEREARALSTITDDPERPLVAILGGARLSDKSGALERLVGLADVVCIGGAICFPLLAAGGHSVGDSSCTPEELDLARQVLAEASAAACRLVMPDDLFVAEGAYGASDTHTRALDGVDVPDGWAGVDIGQKTAERFAAEISVGATVFWDGPMGRFELEPSASGTRAVASAIATARATTIVAGGETAQAVRSLGLDGHISHVSTGGQAALAFLAGRALPALEVLLGPVRIGR